ncbi:pro-neuregulin-4, membrane-bound isoform-like [Syngnathus typhle]|uniref:pro-neuregulin-4, membrane-bound isoform-like n=1 Tax=Syngnathus typhle TaxID=161592 RepID=UPI002A69CA6E|nr:pro-neuregulin-4, membrane-bound isoform-like [Syngnathus typhle]
MMGEHGMPCDGEDAAYCMNGGTCYKLASMDTLSCVCNNYYKGSRCEQFQLLLGSTDKEQAGLVVALVLVGLLILVVFSVIIYFTYKMLKAKRQKKQSHTEYWKVPPRV